MKKFIQEFKEFCMKGSMIDLAIGIIVGGAFTAIVGSLVSDIINPIIGIFTGNIDFSNLFVSLDGKTYDSLAQVDELGGNVFRYGSFISAVINFVIICLVVFIMVKIVNKARTKAEALKKKEPEAAPTTKACPFCQSEINIAATRCPHCTSLIEVDK